MRRFTLIPVALAFSFIAAPLHAGLVGYWTFSNGSNLGQDSSGNGNNLTGTGDGANTPGFDPTGNSGQGAAIFDGTDWLVDTTGFPTGIPTGNADYTILAWIQLSTPFTGGYGIIGWGAYSNDGGSDTNAFRTDFNGGIDNYWWGNDITADSCCESVFDGAWHLVAATWDSETGTRTVYVDPQLSNGYSNSDNPGSNNADALNFTVGQTCPTCGEENFVGEISDLAVFDSALTQNQIVEFGTAPEPGTFLLGLAALALAFARHKLRSRSGALGHR